MSVVQMAQVWRHQLPFNQAWVLMALADHADDDGTNCYPAVPYIAWKTGYSERQVRRIIRELREADALIPIDGDEGPGRPVHYQIAMDALPSKPPYERPKRYLSPATRVRIIERDGRHCRYCGRPGTWTHGPDGQRWNIDRIVPAALGGTYEDSNVALACGTCNRSKGANLAHLNEVPFETDKGAISDPMDAIVESSMDAIAESPKPSLTTKEPSEEPSVYKGSWRRTLRAIEGWAEKGEPHMDTLHLWIEEKGWNKDQLEASAIGLAATSEKTLKGYRNLVAAFQRRLNQGYDNPGHGDNGRRAGQVPAAAGGQEGEAGGGWDNRR